jgi:hypothetical protein
MICADFERLIALDVEGDLPQSKGRVVAEHLLACPSCRQFAERLKFSQTLLKELGREPVGEPMLTEVRSRVRVELARETQPQGFPWWYLALGAGLVATLIFAVPVPRRHSPGVNTRVAAEQTTPANGGIPMRASNDEMIIPKIAVRPAKSSPAAVGLRHAARRASKENPISPTSSLPGTPKTAQGVPSSKYSRGSLRASANGRHPQSLTIKLLTDNPNVVIYWLID